MKRTVIIFAACMLLLSGIAFAQDSPIDKGSYQLGGGISFSSWSGDLYENGNGDGQTMITFNPFASYFFIDGLAIGAELDLANTSQGDAKQSSFGFGPQVAYYFTVGQRTETKGSIFPYVGASFDYMTTTFNDGSPGAQDFKTKGTEFGLFGGADYMLNNSVAIFGQLEYDMDSFKVTDPVEGQSVDGTVFGFFTGFTFFLP